MLDIALKLLHEINSHSHQAYIVGGFVRDYLLGIESNDIDIATSATPKEIKEIFEDSCLPNEDYGSVTVIMRGVRFEITTFRKEIGYINNRKPEKIKYIDDLYQDLVRRDFTINALCMDSNGEVLDLLGGKDDLNSKVIKTIGNSYERFEEDSLRILRAIRFATILNFKLDSSVIDAIIDKKGLLKNLSFYRKKEELEKIFTSPNYKEGVKLLLDLGLEKELNIANLSKVLECNTINLIGIWAILDVDKRYPFNKNELSLINDIREVMKLDNLDPMVLYKYGLYVNSVVGEIKGIDIKTITEAYNSLVIKSRKDIDIDTNTIMNIFNKKPGGYLRDVYNDIETNILEKKINNNHDDICNYISSNLKRWINL